MTPEADWHLSGMRFGMLASRSPVTADALRSATEVAHVNATGNTTSSRTY